MLERIKTGLQKFFPLIGIFTLTLALSCASAPQLGGPIIGKSLKDGIYEGTYKHGPNKATVRVTIENHSITNIDIIEHWAWRGKKAEPIIVKRILEQQSSAVDAVTGATNSSNVIMNAVQKAVEKAQVEK